MLGGGVRVKLLYQLEKFGYRVVFPTSWNRLNFISENVCRFNINVPTRPVENMSTYTDHTR